MKKYHVTYYYLATGMEGRADTQDYGIIYASSKEEAISKVGYRRDPKEPNKVYREWGLSAKEVK